MIKNNNGMNKKLTLTIQQEVIEKAKKYAKEKGRSLSDLVENYFRSITINEQPIHKQKGSIASSLIGSVKEPENFDYKKELEKALAEKHLKNG